VDYWFQLASIFSLVASVLVGGYAVVYSWILWDEAKHGKARKDWNVSVLFYAGIVLAILGNVLNAIDDLYPCGARYLSPFAYLAGLVLFFLGFRKRAARDVK
jgi:hypothetical protein